jgi:hypothetical protein
MSKCISLYNYYMLISKKMKPNNLKISTTSSAKCFHTDQKFHLDSNLTANIVILCQ